MAKKAISGKHLSPNELVGILSDNIRNVRNGLAEVEEVNAISRAVRGICEVTSTQMRAHQFLKQNPEFIGEMPMVSNKIELKNED